MWPVLRFPTSIKFLPAHRIHDLKSRQQFVCSMVTEPREEVSSVSVCPKSVGYHGIMASHLLKRLKGLF